MRDADAVGSALRGSAFVGRVAELAIVDALLASVRAGRPSTLLVAGEAGIGKSRLVGELRQRATAAGALVATGRTPVEGVGLPYGTVFGLLRDLRRQLGPEDQERLEPARALLLGAADPGEHGKLTRVALFEEVLGAVDGIAAARPLVLVLEDVHWADAGSVEMLDHLVRNLDDQPVLVVTTYRAEELDARPPLRRVVVEMRRLPSTTTIDLTGLAPDEVAALVADATGETQAWTVVDAIHQRSAGNPMFAEELAAVRHERVLPPALRDLLAVRIERLPDASRRVVAAASVLGATCDHRLLAAVVELDGADLDTAIEDVVRRGLLIADGAPGMLRFRHALLQEAAHDALLPGERARLHGRAAEALAEDPGLTDGAGGVAARLAEHRFEAGSWAGACEAAIDAATTAISLYSLHAAHAQLQRAIEAHRRARGACRHPHVDDARLFAMAAETAYLISEMDLAFELVNRSVAALPVDAAPARIATSTVLFARCAAAVDRFDMAFELLAGAADKLRDSDDQAAFADVVCMQGRLSMAAGRFIDSVRLCNEALELSRRSGAPVVEGHALSTLGPSLACLGDFDSALAAGRESIVVAEATGDPDLLLRAYNNLADVQMQACRIQDAAQLALDAAADTGPLGAIRLGSAGFNGTESLIILGRWDEAATMATMLLGKASACCVSDALNLALLALRRGDVEGAEAELAGRMATGPQATANREAILAEIELERDRPEAAAAAVDRALAALAGSGYGIETVRAHALGLRALADQTARPVRPGRRAGDDPTKSLRLAEAILAEVDVCVAASTQEGGTPSVWFEALRRLCIAEATRLRGSDPDAWSTAAATWREFGDPYHVAYCTLRLAEALLAGRADRRAATDALTDAWRSARALGAGTLIARCERLAERARIQLEDPRGPDSSPRQRAAADLGLTAREAEVLDLLARDRTDGQIADELFISKKTASVHVSNILRKLDARDRWHAGEMGRSAALGQ